MYVEQLYTECLSEAAYYIESEGEAAIIDPLRDTDTYLALAAKRHAKIKYIFETHIHADFVSGHLDLAAATHAPIIYGPDNQATFDIITAKDGEKFPLGKCQIKAIHTPGHTLESTCYLLIDEKGKDYALFTGDTLFIGDVGRPDLAQKGEELSIHDLTDKLYDSLHGKIMPLADNLIIYPAHGAGSSCGKNMSKETSSTLGEQKKTNYALLATSKENFFAAVTAGLTEPPVYFPINVELNKKGYTKLDNVLHQALTPLSPDTFEAKIKEDNSIVIDTRTENEFSEGFIPGSIFIGINGRFAEWAGKLLPFDQTIYLITHPGQEKEAFTRLARVGFEKFGGYLEGGFDNWKKAGKRIDLVINIEPDELAMDYKFDKEIIIVDVRNAHEYAEGHIKNAVSLPLEDLTDPAGYLSDIEDDFNLYLHCAGGYRSMIAASLIKKEGFHNIHNIIGGYNALAEIKELPKEKDKAVLN